MDHHDRDLITGMCQRFNIPFMFRDEPDCLAFVLGDTYSVELELPSDDNEQQWTVTRIDIIPGVWRTANGDGWPDVAEGDTVFQSKMLLQALVEAIKLTVERESDIFIDLLRSKEEEAAMEGVV